MQFDHVVIGAGPSGLACALRLALAGWKVALIEKHTVIGGLNSFYQRIIKVDGQKTNLELDVGLHAITNFSKGNNKSSTLSKLLRGLRITKDNLKLCEQNFSFIRYGEKSLKFTNEIEVLTKEINEKYPKSINDWQNFLSVVANYNEFDPNQPEYISTQIELKKIFHDQNLIHHLLFPVLTYGSAWEEDMDFNLFICLFRSMFLEGFCRPQTGIRGWWNEVVKNLKLYGVEIFLGEAVEEINVNNNCVQSIKTNKRTISTHNIYSSAGLIETEKFLTLKKEMKSHESPLGFVELLLVFDQDFSEQAELPTLAFCTDSLENYYSSTDKTVDISTAIYCFPSRYQGKQENSSGLVRMTCLTNPKLWFDLSPTDYRAQKKAIEKEMLEKFFEEFKHIKIFKEAKIIFSDLFTPKTIHKFTSHHMGSLYGATKKIKNAKSTYQGLYYIGADQGYPGIVGAMLSGVTVANNYGIMQSNQQVQV